MMIVLGKILFGCTCKVLAAEWHYDYDASCRTYACSHSNTNETIF